MKTISGSTRSPGAGPYVGLMLALTALLAVQGAGLALALGSAARAGGLEIAAIASGMLTALAAAGLAAAALARSSRPAGEAGPAAALARPRGAEQAAALAHAQKMEALGLLAGGVAHDFNNQLHVIRNSLEILQRQGGTADNRRYLEMIRRSADRAAALTRQLLAFARRQPLELRPIDPNELVAQVAELLRHALGEPIRIDTVLQPGVARIAADAGQLETALLNLGINARDAMSHAGRVTIETANVALESSLRACVMIAVSDTGSGMAPEVAARACEPFFTTKEPGHGTGLGLSQVAGFARAAGGEIRISSAPGRGTTVRLYLPRALPEAAAPIRAPVKRPLRPGAAAAPGVALVAGVAGER